MAVETGSFAVSPGSTKTSFNIQSKPGMAPTARLLVYCTKKDGEIVVDTLNVKIDDPFQNQVRIFKWWVVHIMYSSAIGDTISASLFFHVVKCNLMEFTTRSASHAFAVSGI